MATKKATTTPDRGAVAATPLEVKAREVRAEFDQIVAAGGDAFMQHMGSDFRIWRLWLGFEAGRLWPSIPLGSIERAKSDFRFQAFMSRVERG